MASGSCMESLDLQLLRVRIIFVNAYEFTNRSDIVEYKDMAESWLTEGREARCGRRDGCRNGA